MEAPDYRNSIARAVYAWAALVMVLPVLGGVARAQAVVPEANSTSDSSRIDRLEQMLQSVVAENRRLSAEVRTLTEQLNARSPEVPMPAVEPLTPPAIPFDSGSDFSPSEVQTPTSSSSAVPLADWGELVRPRYKVDYDGGFVIVPEDLDESPFSLKINNQNQFRYTGFERGASTWTDSAGRPIPLYDTSNFQIPRGRLIFSGKAFLPEISYLLNIDYNTVNNNPIGFRAYGLSYRFSRALEVSVGLNKVPGSREWLGSAFVGQEGPDRSMATTFFRPSLSQGIWMIGEPVDGLHYHAMVSNGFNTLNAIPSQLDNRFCWSGSGWWEPWGDFGPGYPDIEAHQQWVMRVGGSYTYDIGHGTQSGSTAPENSAIRLSDGTIITQPGAFAPGVTLERYDLSLAALDLALKYRGFSLSTEMYAQDLLGLKGNGPLPLSSTQAYGGVLQGGYFVVPQRLEFYSRTSFVTGKFGGGEEFGGGFNWFPLSGKNNMRVTVDATWLEHSPADQIRTGYVAGATGILIRAQISTSF